MLMTTTNFSNFIANITLTKKGVFGGNVIIISVTPSLKIINLHYSYKTNLPFNKGELLNVQVFSEWVIKNNYKFSFTTKNSKLKRDLYFYFDDLIIESGVTKKKYTDSNVGDGKIFTKKKDIY